jgi:hypothetical protein
MQSTITINCYKSTHRLRFGFFQQSVRLEDIGGGVVAIEWKDFANIVNMAIDFQASLPASEVASGWIINPLQVGGA